MPPTFDVAACRAEFPALSRRVEGRPAIFFDGPAGSQVPRRVTQAVTDYLLHANANSGGVFATSVESDALVNQALRAAADFWGVSETETAVFGANMTTLTFALSRSLSKIWKPGDEVLVTQLDHDANVTPWKLAAADAGVRVRTVRMHPEDCTLDLEDFQRQLTPRTRLVAVGCASNAAGTVNPVRKLVEWAHAVGSEVFVDAVHSAPHLLPDVQAWGCDFAVCSAYKFFGPHVGLLWGRRDRLERLPAFKVRPASEALPWRWMTGTPNMECIAGTRAAIEYLAGLSGREGCTRENLVAAYERIHVHESALAARMLDGLQNIPDIQVRGITDKKRLAERVSTFSFTHRRFTATEIAKRLAAQGIFVWNGNFYAQSLSEALGLEPEGMVRIGLLHYATLAEVDRCLAVLAAL